MVRNRLSVYTDEQLLKRLQTVRELELEVNDPWHPYNAHEWGGVDRRSKSTELFNLVDELTDECKRRGLSYLEILWPEADDA